jgi:hypothetical protein
MLLMAALGAPLSASATVHSRVENQRDRINNGYNNGGINRRQYSRDMARLRTIRHQTRTERRQDGGHLTHQERERSYRELNGLGERINDQRHNQPGEPPT